MRQRSNTLTSICLWHGQNAENSEPYMLLKNTAGTAFYFRAEQKNCAATRLEATLENCNLLNARKKTASQNPPLFAPRKRIA